MALFIHFLTRAVVAHGLLTTRTTPLHDYSRLERKERIMTAGSMATRRTRSSSSTLIANKKNSKSAPSIASDVENDTASHGTGVGSEKKVGRPSTKAASATPRSKRMSGSRKKEQTFCSCRGKDDGSPMINCEGCSNW